MIAGRLIIDVKATCTEGKGKLVGGAVIAAGDNACQRGLGMLSVIGMESNVLVLLQGIEYNVIAKLLSDLDHEVDGICAGYITGSRDVVAVCILSVNVEVENINVAIVVNIVNIHVADVIADLKVTEVEVELIYNPSFGTLAKVEVKLVIGSIKAILVFLNVVGILAVKLEVPVFETRL